MCYVNGARATAFKTHERVFLWKSQSVWTENVSTLCIYICVYVYVCVIVAAIGLFCEKLDY